MSYLFTSESVSKGHPDKIADQISDAILDEFLRKDAEARVACETMVTTGTVILSGEITAEAYVDLQTTARNVIERVGYTKGEYMFDSRSCGIQSHIHEQSRDISRGVDTDEQKEQGAGDQGMMFGYACRETKDFMPLPIVLSHVLLMTLDDIRQGDDKLMPYLRPDAKSQFTVEYDDNGKPLRIDTIVLSTQHDEFVDNDEAMLKKIRQDVVDILLPRFLQSAALNDDIRQLFAAGEYCKKGNPKGYKLFVNPTGKFVIGGPHGDTGLTGRKIIVDTYGGRGAHGGGAFSGKDSSKVDRSGAYAARHIAKNLVAAGVCDEALVQISYAIGVAQPVGFYVNTYGTSHVALSDGELAERIFHSDIVNLTPAGIVKHFGLKNPIFLPTAAYGHFGRDPYYDVVSVVEHGVLAYRKVRFFAWEDLDYVEPFRKLFADVMK